MKGRLKVENYRGLPVPRTLGIWLAAAALVSAVMVSAGGTSIEAAGWIALAAGMLVFAAGLVDDLVPGGPRGMRAHLRTLAAGRFSTGILKVLVTIACAVVVVAAAARPGPWLRVAGVVLVAACTNLWNGLDVRPGRSLKWFLVAAACFARGDPAPAPMLPGLAVASLLALVVDLRERAMLGDGGSNLLGFAAGVGLYLWLPASGVVIGAVVAVGLNVVADTVTLSRVIESTPPLRWFDGLGRVRARGDEDVAPPE